MQSERPSLKEKNYSSISMRRKGSSITPGGVRPMNTLTIPKRSPSDNNHSEALEQHQHRQSASEKYTNSPPTKSTHELIVEKNKQIRERLAGLNDGHKYTKSQTLPPIQPSYSHEVKDCCDIGVNIKFNNLLEPPLVILQLKSFSFNGNRVKNNGKSNYVLSVSSNNKFLFITKDGKILDKYLIHRQTQLKSLAFSDDSVLIELQNQKGLIVATHYGQDQHLREYFNNHHEWNVDATKTIKDIELVLSRVKRAEKVHPVASTSPPPKSSIFDPLKNMKRTTPTCITRSNARQSMGGETEASPISIDQDDSVPSTTGGLWEDDIFQDDDFREHETPAPFVPDLKYQFPGNKVFTITATDFKTLYNNDWINDTVIDFFIQYEIDQALKANPKLDSNDIYAFNSFFFTKLTHKTTPHEAPDYYANIKRWLSKIQLMEYPYVIMPINEHAHWYGCIIRGLPYLLKVAKEEAEAVANTSQNPVELHSPQPDEEDENNSDIETAGGGPHPNQDHKPRKYVCEIFIFDSLSHKHANIKLPLKRFIIDYCKDIYNLDILKNQIRVVNARVPKQNNFNDCGIHVIYNIRKWINNIQECEKIWRTSHSSTQSQVSKTLFSAEERNGMRKQLTNILLDLHEKQEKHTEVPKLQEDEDDVIFIEHRSTKPEEKPVEQQTTTTVTTNYPKTLDLRAQEKPNRSNFHNSELNVRFGERQILNIGVTMLNELFPDQFAALPITIIENVQLFLDSLSKETDELKQALIVQEFKKSFYSYKEKSKTDVQISQESNEVSKSAYRVSKLSIESDSSMDQPMTKKDEEGSSLSQGTTVVESQESNKDSVTLIDSYSDDNVLLVEDSFASQENPIEDEPRSLDESKAMDKPKTMDKLEVSEESVKNVKIKPSKEQAKEEGIKVNEEPAKKVVIDIFNADKFVQGSKQKLKRPKQIIEEANAKTNKPGSSGNSSNSTDANTNRAAAKPTSTQFEIIRPGTISSKYFYNHLHEHKSERPRSTTELTKLAPKPINGDSRNTTKRRSVLTDSSPVGIPKHNSEIPTTFPHPQKHTTELVNIEANPFFKSEFKYLKSEITKPESDVSRLDDINQDQAKEPIESSHKVHAWPQSEPIVLTRKLPPKLITRSNNQATFAWPSTEPLVYSSKSSSEDLASLKSENSQSGKETDVEKGKHETVTEDEIADSDDDHSIVEFKPISPSVVQYDSVPNSGGIFLPDIEVNQESRSATVNDIANNFEGTAEKLDDMDVDTTALQTVYSSRSNSIKEVSQDRVKGIERRDPPSSEPAHWLRFKSLEELPPGLQNKVERTDPTPSHIAQTSRPKSIQKIQPQIQDKDETIKKIEPTPSSAALKYRTNSIHELEHDLQERKIGASINHIIIDSQNSNSAELKPNLEETTDVGKTDPSEAINDNSYSNMNIPESIDIDEDESELSKDKPIDVDSADEVQRKVAKETKPSSRISQRSLFDFPEDVEPRSYVARRKHGTKDPKPDTNVKSSKSAEVRTRKVIPKRLRSNDVTIIKEHKPRPIFVESIGAESEGKREVERKHIEGRGSRPISVNLVDDTNTRPITVDSVETSSRTSDNSVEELQPMKKHDFMEEVKHKRKKIDDFIVSKRYSPIVLGSIQEVESENSKTTRKLPESGYSKTRMLRTQRMTSAEHDSSLSEIDVPFSVEPVEEMIPDLKYNGIHMPMIESDSIELIEPELEVAGGKSPKFESDSVKESETIEKARPVSTITRPISPSKVDLKKQDNQESVVIHEIESPIREVHRTRTRSRGGKLMMLDTWASKGTIIEIPSYEERSRSSTPLKSTSPPKQVQRSNSGEIQITKQVINLEKEEITTPRRNPSKRRRLK